MHEHQMRFLFQQSHIDMCSHIELCLHHHQAELCVQHSDYIIDSRNDVRSD